MKFRGKTTSFHRSPPSSPKALSWAICWLRSWALKCPASKTKRHCPIPNALAPNVGRPANSKNCNRASFKPLAGQLNLLSLSIIAKNAAGLFFPLTRWIGVEHDCQLSPGMLVKAIHAGSSATSFAAASDDLGVLAETEISAKRLGRLVERIGNERVAEIQQQANALDDLPLVQRQQSPTDVVVPSLVCVQFDGGRLQIRDRVTPSDRSDDANSSFWRESKVGALIKMTGKTYERDPCPEIPTIFVDPARMSRLTREIKGFSGDKGEPTEATAASDAVESESLIKPDELHVSTRPQPLVRSVIATTGNVQAFGKLLAGAAYARGFMAAERRAFVGDGMACNWTLHEKHFGRFTPILDIVHAICYLYHAAIGGDPSPESWQRYCDWAQWLWGGEIDQLLESMRGYQAEIRLPQESDKETSARALLADAIRYIGNQRSRMNYARYRQEGLPITSAYIESTIKQINRRVKGTEKFWSVNADPMLQLRADFISENQPMAQFWKRRKERLSIWSQYKMAV